MIVEGGVSSPWKKRGIMGRWRVGAGLVLLGLCAVCIDGSQRVSAQDVPKVNATRRPSTGAVARGGHVPRCMALNKQTIRSAFRELTCLVSWRRSLKVRTHRVDRLIFKRFRQLHQRLRAGAKDWRIVHRWQALYKLGTRMYPLENRWAANARIPVYEVNGHHKSMPFWLKEAMRRKVGPLLHLDAHADMADVPSYKKVMEAVDKLRHNRDVRGAWHTIAHSISDCAMPVTGGVLAGAYKRVIWGIPGWVQEPLFLARPFFFAASRFPLPGLKELWPHKSEGRGHHRRKSGTSHDQWSGVLRLFYDPKADRPGRKPLRKHGVYWQQVSAKQRPHRRHFTSIRRFDFSILRTDLKIDAQGRGADAAAATTLLRAIPKGPFTLDLDLDYFASIDSDRPFARRAGVQPNIPLSTFQYQRKLLEKRLQRFHRMLLFLKRHKRVPALVTIADSTFFSFALDAVADGQSEYAPLEHAAYLRQQVRKLLRHVYGRDVDGRSCQRPPTFSAATLPRLSSTASANPDKRSQTPSR